MQYLFGAFAAKGGRNRRHYNPDRHWGLRCVNLHLGKKHCAVILPVGAVGCGGHIEFGWCHPRRHFHEYR